MRRALVLAIVALGAVLAAPRADAHYNTARLGYRSTIIAINPPLAGVTAKVLFGDDQVLLDNRSRKTIVILGYDGEPYIRFSASGIYVNNNSPSLYLNADRYAKSSVPAHAKPGAKPDWHRLISGNVWAWHDHRIHWMSPIPPKLISDAPRARHHLFDWKVPATANGKRFTIKGSLDYVPPPKSSFPVTLAIALGTLIALGTIGLFALRRVILRSLE